MLYDEVVRTFPLGAQLWCSTLAAWVEVKGHHNSINYPGEGYVVVSKMGVKGGSYVCDPRTLYVDENHTPVPACGPGAYNQPGASKSIPAQPVVIPQPEEKHVAGHSPERVTEEAWKAFKEML